MSLVLGVMVCFCIQLSYIQGTTAGEVFKGYLPSSAIVEGNGIYLSCGIIGATVMPHSIFLGSGVVQPRLKQFDQQNGHIALPDDSDDEPEKYVPSIYAIKACLKYSIVELATSLFTFALFINSAILIVSGASLPKDRGHRCRPVRYLRPPVHQSVKGRRHLVCHCSSSVRNVRRHCVYHGRPDGVGRDAALDAEALVAQIHHPSHQYCSQYHHCWGHWQRRAKPGLDGESSLPECHLTLRHRALDLVHLSKPHYDRPSRPRRTK